MNQIRTLFEDQVFFNTVLIENLSDGVFGTGFIINKKVDDKLDKVLLFSNKHVFWGNEEMNKKDAKKRLQFTFHRRGEDGEYRLGTTVKVVIDLDRAQKGYFDHPDEAIDVGCVNISAIYNQQPIENKGIRIEEFSSFDMGTLSVGQRVVFVGYPQGFFDLKNFLPIARFGTIASIPSIDFNGEKQILIDAAVYPGSSGSPVFFQHGDGNYKLLGIISSAPIRALDYLNASEKLTPVEKKIAVKFIGLGILFKLETLKTVFDLV